MTIKETAKFFERKQINEIKPRRKLIDSDNVVQIAIIFCVILGFIIWWVFR